MGRLYSLLNFSTWEGFGEVFKKPEISIKKLKDLNSNIKAPKQKLLVYSGENRKLGGVARCLPPVF